MRLGGCSMPPEILGLLEDINEAIGFIVEGLDCLPFVASGRG